MTVSAYEKARLSRDARFDGRFFTAVLTTGIYCRPVCPAKPPKSRNVRFYPTAAAAEEAGFRPCLRCRPETAPGTPPWAGTSTTVSRGLRLIEDGALDRGSLDELAGRLGVTARHLHRLFRKHLGASPVAVAQTRRLKIAKRLLDETPLPLTQVALAAGYGSLRRFNAAFQERFGRAPRDLRRQASGSNKARAIASGNGKDVYCFRLVFRPPYDWGGMAGFLGARAIAGLEHVTPSSYARTISLDGQAGWFEVSRLPGRNQLQLQVHFPRPAALYRIIQRVRAMFDLDAAPREIEAQLRSDLLLRKSLRKFPGLRVPGCWDGFELAVRAVLGQQVSVAGARTLTARLVRQYGKPAPGGVEGLDTLFPAAVTLARARFSGVGVTGARARTLRTLASEIASGGICLDHSADPARTAERLAGIPGMGDWTVQYIAMRALGNPDAFPAADLGVLKALSNGRRLKPEQARARAEPWRPWRAYGVMHLWTGRGAHRNSDQGR